jgi:hypothetical protein
MNQPLLDAAFAQQQANRAALLRREQSNRTVAKAVKATTTPTK